MSYDTPSSDEESAAPFIISHGHEIKNNLKFLRMNDSFNDVKIIFNDGIVFANSVIMSSASDYFSTMLNSDKFVEAQTKEVPMEEYGTGRRKPWRGWSTTSTAATWTWRKW